MPEITPAILAAADKVDRDLDALDMSTRTLLSLLRAGDVQPPGGGGGGVVGPASYVAHTTGQRTGAGTLTVSVPVDAQENDVLVLLVFDEGAASASASGWDAVANAYNNNFNRRVWAFTRVAPASIPASYDATTSGTSFGVIIATRGVDITTPVRASGTASLLGKNIDLPDVAVEAGDLLVSLMIRNSAGSFTAWTNSVTDRQSVAFNFTGGRVATKEIASGTASGVTNAAWSAVASNGGIQFSLRGA